MSKKYTLVAYLDGDRTQSVTKVVTATSCEMDKNRTLSFCGGYGVTALRVNKDEWISVQPEDAAVDIIGTRALGGGRQPRARKPRKSRAKK
jgi:hypothetical protein